MLPCSGRPGLVGVFVSRTRGCHVLVSTLLAATAALAVAVSSHAAVSFGPTRVLNPDPAVSSGGTFGVATDGKGTWLVGVRIDGQVRTMRSTDRGRSWSGAGIIPLSPLCDPEGLSSGGAGNWLVLCSEHNITEAVFYSRSTDAGATWSALQLLDNQLGTKLRAAGDGLGNWLAVWESFFPVADTLDIDIVAVRSSDGGQSWTAPVVLNLDDPDVFDLDSWPDVATNRRGTWVVVWENRTPRSGGGHGDNISLRRSTDNGATWSDPVSISAGPMDWRPRVAADAAGNWVITFIRDRVPGVGQVMVSYSDDDAVSWSEPQRVDPATAATPIDSEYVRLATDGAGTWTATWRSDNTLGGTIGSDLDILVAHSLDNGRTWTSPAALSNASGKGEPRDAREFVAEIAAAPDGTWVSAWTSQAHDVGTVGDIGDDSDVFFAVSRADCPQQPAAGCRGPVEPGDAQLVVRDSKGGRDRLIWKWTRGAATALADLGDPTSATDYVLCLYDWRAGAPLLVFEKDIEAGDTCGDKPCWEATRRGFAYRDADARRTHGAVKALSLRAGEAGRARIRLKAKGPTLAPPRLPLASNATKKVQMFNLESGDCWEATYGTVVTNTRKRFRAFSE